MKGAFCKGGEDGGPVSWACIFSYVLQRNQIVGQKNHAMLCAITLIDELVERFRTMALGTETWDQNGMLWVGLHFCQIRWVLYLKRVRDIIVSRMQCLTGYFQWSR